MVIINSIADDDLVSSFYNFVDTFEADALRNCAAGCNSTSSFQQVVIPLLSRLQYNSIPEPVDVAALLPKVAKFALLVKPHFALSEICRGMNEAHPSFWGRCSNPTLMCSIYEMLVPTSERVLAMVSEPEFQTSGQQRVFDYLRRFIQSLSTDELGKFLRFTTGYSICGPIRLIISFNTVQGFQRRPTANTCTPSLCFSVAYLSYSDFHTEFLALLNSSHLWHFDSI